MSGWQERIRLREIYRYMGMRQQDADEAMQELVKQQLGELLQAATVRTYVRIFPVEFLDGAGHFRIGPMEVRSRDLGRNLQGCGQAALFGVTLGLEVDRLIYRLGRTAVGRAVITDACAAEVVEAVCNELCAGLREEAVRQGCRLRPRFSPGFGDFTLAYQLALLQVLELDKRIGVTLTEGGMMNPAKSVTAVAGFYGPQEG